MQPTFTISRPRQLSSVVKWEVNPDYTRGSGLVKASAVIALGMVLGQVATGELVPLDMTKSDGSQTFAAIALQDFEAPADATLDDSDNRILTLIGGPSIVSASGLVWPAGIADADKATVLAEIKAAGIKVSNY